MRSAFPVLGVRSGLVEAAQMREGLAATAALYDHRVGRSWRSLVDTKIRELSGDKRSLDDWARVFFGVENGSHEPLTYTFRDIMVSLNAVQPFDWQAFLSARLNGHGPGAPRRRSISRMWKRIEK
jgi:predicted metalloprotease with PDZ domain